MKKTLLLAIPVLLAACSSDTEPQIDDTTLDLSSASSVSSIATRLELNLQAALMDEFKAEAFYNGVIEKFGEGQPFSNIVRSEQQHSAQIIRLLKQNEFPVPPKPEAPTIPDTIAEACAMGVQGELDNIALYDQLMSSSKNYPEAIKVFKNLMTASQTRHLPAFERCADDNPISAASDSSSSEEASIEE